MAPSDLTELFGGRHFNMPDRIERGMWLHAPLSLSALIAHLVTVISDRAWFPEPFRPAQPGEEVADIAIVERRGSSEYVVHVQASGASGRTVAGYRAATFSSAESAAEFYLRVGLRLPGDLDGWQVVA